MSGRLIAVTAIGLMMAGSAASAQENGNAAPHGNATPPAMMGQNGHMGMMGMEQAQMQRMMDNCSRMMESRMQKAPMQDKKG